MRPPIRPVRRNPERRARPSAPPTGGPRTPGRRLFELALAQPPGDSLAATERNIRLVEQAARLLKAEAEAGLWRDA